MKSQNKFHFGRISTFFMVHLNAKGSVYIFAIKMLNSYELSKNSMKENRTD